MPTTTSPALEAVRESVEALSLEATLRDVSSQAKIQALIAPMMKKIGLDARAAGMTMLAAMSTLTPGTEAELLNVIAHMQQQVATPDAKPKAPAASLNQDPELISDFILESREHLAAVEAQLLILEKNPADAEAINTIFRGFHTIKGLAGFLEFPGIQRFAHEVETLLDLARTSKLTIDSPLIDLILQCTDYMNQCLSGVETGHETASDSEPSTNFTPRSPTEPPPG